MTTATTRRITRRGAAALSAAGAVLVLSVGAIAAVWPHMMAASNIVTTICVAVVIACGGYGLAMSVALGIARRGKRPALGGRPLRPVP